MSAIGSLNLVIDESPLICIPVLASAIGVDEALVVQQIHYWIRHAMQSREPQGFIDKDGTQWIYNTIEQWHEQNFYFWSESKIKRLMLKIESTGIIATEKKRAVYGDHKKYYRIDYEILEKVTSVARQKRVDQLKKLQKRKAEKQSSLDVKRPQVVDSIDSSFLNHRSSSFDPIDRSNLDDLTETTNTDKNNNNTTTPENREPQSWESKQQLDHNWQPSKEIIEALLFSYQSDGMTADHIEIKRFDFIDWWNKPSNRQTQSADGAFRKFVTQGWIKYDKKNYLQSKAAELSVERQQVYLDSAKQKTGKFDPIDSLSNGFDRMIKKQDGRRATKTVTTIEALTDRSWAEGFK